MHSKDRSDSVENDAAFFLTALASMVENVSYTTCSCAENMNAYELPKINLLNSLTPFPTSPSIALSKAFE